MVKHGRDNHQFQSELFINRGKLAFDSEVNNIKQEEKHEKYNKAILKNRVKGKRNFN